jgi:hypothetical protein
LDIILSDEEDSCWKNEAMRSKVTELVSIPGRERERGREGEIKRERRGKGEK